MGSSIGIFSPKNKRNETSASHGILNVAESKTVVSETDKKNQAEYVNETKEGLSIDENTIPMPKCETTTDNKQTNSRINELREERVLLKILSFLSVYEAYNARFISKAWRKQAFVFCKKRCLKGTVLDVDEVKWIYKQFEKNKLFVQKEFCKWLSNIMFREKGLIDNIFNSLRQGPSINATPIKEFNIVYEANKAVQRVLNVKGQYATYPEIAGDLLNGGDEVGKKMRNHRKLFDLLCGSYQVLLTTDTSCRSYCIALKQLELMSKTQFEEVISNGVLFLNENMTPYIESFCLGVDPETQEKVFTGDGRRCFLSGIWNDEIVSHLKELMIHLSVYLKKESKTIIASLNEILTTAPQEMVDTVMPLKSVSHVFFRMLLSGIVERIRDVFGSAPYLVSKARFLIQEILKNNKSREEFKFWNVEAGYEEILRINCFGNETTKETNAIILYTANDFKLSDRGKSWIETAVSSFLDDFITPPVSSEYEKNKANLKKCESGWFLVRLFTKYKLLGFNHSCSSDKELFASIRDFSERYYVNYAIMKSHAILAIVAVGHESSQLLSDERTTHIKELSKSIKASLGREFGLCHNSKLFPGTIGSLEDSEALHRAMHSSYDFIEALVSMGLHQLYRWQEHMRLEVSDFEKSLRRSDKLLNT